MLPDEFYARYSFIVGNLVSDLATFLGLSVQAVEERMNRSYYIDVWFYDFMAKHGNDYAVWLAESQFYLYNSADWHTRVGLHGLSQHHFEPVAGCESCLDFGSGIGTHALIDAALGWNIALCEINRHTAEFARYRFDKYRLQGAFVSSPPAGAKYDLVRIWDVVGHLIDVESTIPTVIGMLRDGGHLNVSFDNDAINDWHRNQNISFSDWLCKLGCNQLSDGLWKKSPCPDVKTMPLET
jgi:2-polyprenyl-3-methyl-5-hydroxy-6-metoxy-1,4-benzoquinol methylase